MRSKIALSLTERTLGYTPRTLDFSTMKQVLATLTCMAWGGCLGQTQDSSYQADRIICANEKQAIQQALVIFDALVLLWDEGEI